MIRDPMGFWVVGLMCLGGATAIGIKCDLSNPAAFFGMAALSVVGAALIVLPCCCNGEDDDYDMTYSY